MTAIGLLIIAITILVVLAIPGDQIALAFIGGLIGGSVAAHGISARVMRR